MGLDRITMKAPIEISPSHNQPPWLALKSLYLDAVAVNTDPPEMLKYYLTETRFAHRRRSILSFELKHNLFRRQALTERRPSTILRLAHIVVHGSMVEAFGEE